MRAMYFAKPLEFRLEVTGEDFVQGQTLTGTLSVTNRDKAPHKKLNLEIGLAYGLFSDIKEQGNKALTILEKQTLAKNITLAPDEENKVSWEISLDHAAPIVSKEGTPFIVYGADLKTVEARGQIDLPVELSPPVSAFIATLENHHAFEARGKKSADGVVETSFKPPGSYPTLNELIVMMRIREQEVELEFIGKGKALKGGEAGGVVSRRNTTKKKVDLAHFGFGGAVPNRALYKELVDTMLPKVAQKVEKGKR